MMIPITRKEKYINEIVGGGNTAPETPQTREELFYAAILGEVVAPSPITRAEKYLAKIANKYSGELPEPVTRIERFIANAAGMDVTIPTPITREEMFWANYALIVEKELSGIPPLTFNAIAGTLKNYRIYGNTVNGESVGNRTGNLFDGVLEKGGIDQQGKNVNTQGVLKTRIRTKKFIEVIPNETYTIKIVASFDASVIMVFYSEESYQSDALDVTSWMYELSNTFNTPENCRYIRVLIRDRNNSQIDLTNISTIMLNSGSTALPYEPYGYRVPVTVSNGTDTQTTNLYLPEQIKIVGNEAEYIDFMEQKQHFVDGTSTDITLPEIAVAVGTNTLTVGAEVQPSNVYIKYEGVR